MLWFYFLFLCWNHTLYRAYAYITWRTLYHTMQPVEWRHYKIDQALRNQVGWIA